MKTIERKTTALLLLFVGTVLSLPRTDFYYQSQGSLFTGVSVPIVASDTFSSCACDLTKGGCDQACCCDTDCPDTVLLAWSLQ